MDQPAAELDRFRTLSDGIFAVIITIMVLALRVPAGHDAKALLDLWPDLASYAVSYIFIAIVWLNHHHIFRHANALTALLAWSNFANLFCISLVPFTTAWLAASKLSDLPTTVYAADFLLVEITYMILMRESFRQSPVSEAQMRARRRLQWIRAWSMATVFAVATVAFFLPTLVRLGLAAAFLVLHIRPDASLEPEGGTADGPQLENEK